MIKTAAEPTSMLIVDTTPGSILGPNPWFQAAAEGVDLVDSLDGRDDVRVVRAKHPDDVYRALRLWGRAGMPVDILGHGGKGWPTMGVDARGYGRGLKLTDPSWARVRGGRVWFRQCWVAQGEEGHERARELGAQGVHFVGHVSKIGATGHSYLVGCRAGSKPWWPVALDPGSSSPEAPNTIPFWHMVLPKWAFERRLKRR